MKDLPVFTTENGVASLTLREIPYSKKAYIRIQSALNPEGLLKDCTDFCKAVGAENIYATGNESLKSYSVHASIIRMVGTKGKSWLTNATAIPLTGSKLSWFRDIYNEKMSDVPNAAYMTASDADTLLASGKGYIIIKEENNIGIGVAAKGTIEMLAATAPGEGASVLYALATVLPDQKIELEVAMENQRAMALYEKAGFCIDERISTWYKIL